MKDTVEIPFVFFFEVKEDLLIDRILKRAETSGRNDDNIETLKKRLATFNGETLPIAEMFER